MPETPPGKQDSAGLTHGRGCCGATADDRPLQHRPPAQTCRRFARGALTVCVALIVLGTTSWAQGTPKGVFRAPTHWSGMFVVGTRNPLHAEAARRAPVLPYPIVIWVQPGTPAAEAGISAGDYLVGTAHHNFTATDVIDEVLAVSPQPLRVQNATGLRVVMWRHAPVTSAIRSYLQLADTMRRPAGAGDVTAARAALAEHPDHPLVGFFGAFLLARAQERAASRDALAAVVRLAPGSVLAEMSQRRLGNRGTPDVAPGSRGGSGQAGGAGDPARSASPTAGLVEGDAGKAAGPGSAVIGDDTDGIASRLGSDTVPLPVPPAVFRAWPLPRRLELLRQLHEQHPRNRAVSYHLALHLLMSVDARAATSSPAQLERDLQDARDLIPDLPHAYHLWGIVLLRARDFEGALEKLDRGVAVAPDHLDLRHNLCIAMLELSRFEDAIPHLQRLAEGRPDDFGVIMMLGRSRFETQDFDGAVDDFERAVKLARNDQQRQHAEMWLQKAREQLASTGGNRSTTDENQRFLIRYAGNSQQDLGDITMDILEAAYDQVTDDLRYKPDVQIQVIFYFTDDFFSVNQAKEWVGAMARGIQILAPLRAGYSDQEAVRETLAHELTHVVINLRTNNNCPTWVHEGLATYQGFKAAYGDGATLRRDYQRLYEKVVDGGQALPPVMRLNLNPKVAGGDEVSLGYLTANLAMRFFIEKHGWNGVDELLTALGKGAHLDNAMEEATGRDMESFQKSFDAWLQNQR